MGTKDGKRTGWAVIPLGYDFEQLKKIDVLDIARRLGLKPNRQNKINCFLHQGDKNPSLQLYADGWRCFGCNEGGDGLDLVAKYRHTTTAEAAAWLSEEYRVGTNREEVDKRLERVHTYPGGQLRKNIYRHSDGKKSAYWQTFNGREWEWARPKGATPLYTSADQMPACFFLVEGEKDVDTLARLGEAAASLPDGSGSKWREEYSDTFKNRTVYIVQDNDKPGRDYAQRIAGDVAKVAKSVHIIDITNAWQEAPEKADTTDLIEHMGDGGGLAALLKLAKEAPAWTPTQSNIFDKFGFYTIPDLTEDEKKPPEFIVDGMIPCGMTFLSGAPKTRKSFFALQLSAAVATGADFLGHKTKRCDVVYFDLEGSKSRVSFRAAKMSAEIPRNVYFANTIERKLADGLVDDIRDLHKQRPSVRLVIIDTYSRARGSYRAGGANAYDADVQFLEPIQRMAIEENISVLFVHHDKKGAGFASDSFERLSGTMGISGSSDAVLNLIAEGKRFDGKAILEFTPRDAKGGEKKLFFDELSNEWRELEETPIDIRGNPVCDWIITNAPERGKIGDFFSYNDVFKRAYRCYSEDAGDKVRRAITDHKADLFLQFGIGVQVGVKSNGQRGVRLINLL